MSSQLDLWVRRDVRDFFAPGALLKRIRTEDDWRMWKPLRHDARGMELYHDSGAVARLRLDKDERIVEAERIEGERARALVRQHIAPLPPNAERTSRRVLGRGNPVDATINALGVALQRRLILVDRLQDGADAQSVWRIDPEYSALEVTESPAGTIAQHRSRAHGDALDAYDRLRRFIPPNATHAPPKTYASDFHRKVAERRADQLSRTALSARQTYLLLLAKEWESGGG